VITNKIDYAKSGGISKEYEPGGSVKGNGSTYYRFKNDLGGITKVHVSKPLNSGLQFIRIKSYHPGTKGNRKLADRFEKHLPIKEVENFIKNLKRKYKYVSEESFRAGGSVPKGFEKELETEDFIYYVSPDSEQVIMNRKSDGSLVSDNYFAENDLYERMIEIANGRENYIYLSPSSKKYLSEFKEKSFRSDDYAF
jgi:hypothetical protein